MDLNNLAKEIHAGNVARGFYEEQPTLKTQLMLVITELSEAVEADRKGKYADVKKYNDRYGLGVNFNDSFIRNIKDSFEDEIADAFIRLLDIAGNREVDILENRGYVYQSVQMALQSRCESIFDISNFTLDLLQNIQHIDRTLRWIQTACKLWNIDLEFHVTEKLKYNATRPYKHGKNY